MEASTLISNGKSEIYHALGPTVGFLLSPREGDVDYCIMEGRIPPGFSVPMHGHPDEESFYILSGSVKVWTEDNGWSLLKKGDFVHIPGNTKHAWKNDSEDPSDGLIITTPRLGEFFREIGTRVEPGDPISPPTDDELQHFIDTAARYKHWLGSPEENKAIGIEM